MEVGKDILDWLIGLEVVDLSDFTQLESDSTLFRANEKITTGILNGIIIAKLLKAVTKKYKDIYKGKYVPSPEGLKADKNPISVQLNWGQLGDILKKMDIHFDNDIKNLVIAGDLEIIIEILREIKTVTDGAERKLRHSIIQSPDRSNSLTKKEVKGKVHNKERMLNLSSLDVTKPLTKTTSLPDFFLLSMCKNFELTPAQAAILLTENSKYLAHLLAKGIKGDFYPIIIWFQELDSHISHIMTLLDTDGKNSSKINDLMRLMSDCKGGLVSKCYEVADAACMFYTHLARELQLRNLQKIGWDWFTNGVGSGLLNTLLCLKRHPDARFIVVDVLLAYGRHNLFETFVNQMKKALSEPPELLFSLKQLLPHLITHGKLHDQLLSCGVIDEWISIAWTYADREHNRPELKMVALKLISDIWCHYPQRIQQSNDDLSLKIILGFRSFLKSKGKAQALTAIVHLFYLFDQFLGMKNPTAPVIYRTLVSILIENQQDVVLRDIFLGNFIEIFQRHDVPINILLEPLTKQIILKTQAPSHKATGGLNLLDYKFFHALAELPNLQWQAAVPLLEVLLKLHQSDILAGNMTFSIILALITRFQNNGQVVDLILKYSRLSLSAFVTGEQDRKPRPSVGSRSSKHIKQNSVVINPTYIDQDTLELQVRRQGIELLRSIIGLKINEVSDGLLPIIIQNNKALKRITKANHKAFLSLLALYGNPTEIIKREEAALARLLAQHQTPASLISRSGSLERLGSTPSRLVHSRSLADPRHLATLDELTKKRKEKEEQEKLEKDAEAKREQQVKGKLRRFIEYRNIVQLGLTRSVDNVSGNSHSLLCLEEGMAAKMVSSTQGNGGKELDFEVLGDYSVEEQYVQDWLEYLKKRYNKVIQMIFRKYAGMQEKTTIFDLASEVVNKVSGIEMAAFLKDYNLGGAVSKDDITYIIRRLNSWGDKAGKSTESLERLSWEHFDKLLVNLSSLIFSRKPFNLGHLPLPAMFQKLIDEIKSVTANKGESVKQFEEPELLSAADPQLIKHFNELILEDPEISLPPDYQKYKEKTIEFSAGVLPVSLGIPQPHRDCYEILSGILFEAVGVHLVDQISHIEYIPKVRQKMTLLSPTKPLLYNLRKAPNSSQEIPQTTKQEADHSLKRSPTSGVSNLQVKFKPQLGLRLRVELTMIERGSRATAEEVAYVLEDLLKAVEGGRDKVMKRNEFGAPDIPNKVKLERAHNEEEAKKEEEIRNERLKGRKTELESKLLELKKKAEEEEQLKKSQEDKSKAKKQAKQKKKEEELSQYLNENKKKIEENKKVEAEKKAQAEEAEKTKKQRQQEDNKKILAALVQKQKEVNASLAKKKEEAKKHDEHEQETKEEHNRKEALKARETAVRALGERKEKGKAIGEKIINLFNRSEITELFQRYEKQLQFLYDQYSDQAFVQIDSRFQQNHQLFYQPIIMFAKEFNILPTIISLENVSAIAKSLLKNKPLIDGARCGLSYDDFKQLLLRLAVKGQKVFDRIYTAIADGNSLGNKTAVLNALDHESTPQLIHMDENEEKNEDEVDHKLHADDNVLEAYEHVDGTTEKTLEGLLLYFNLPDTKQGMVDRVKAARSLRIPNKMRRDLMMKTIADAAKRRQEENEQQPDGEENEDEAKEKVNDPEYKEEDMPGEGEDNDGQSDN